MDITDINVGDIVYPYGSPSRLGILRETLVNEWGATEYRVDWVNPRKGDARWERNVRPLRGLIEDTEMKLATHRVNEAKVRHFFGVGPDPISSPGAPDHG